MNFVQELNESRLYRRLGQLKGKTLGDVAERVFEHMLALQIVVQEKPDYALRYAKRIWTHQNFGGFRSTQPDLYNLLALLLNPSQYEHILEIDDTYYVPELRLRRVLRDLNSGRYNNNDYSELMMWLQRHFDNLTGVHMMLRRQISSWARLSPAEKRSVIKRLMIQMRDKGIQSDLYMQLQYMLD